MNFVHVIFFVSPSPSPSPFVRFSALALAKRERERTHRHRRVRPGGKHPTAPPHAGVGAATPAHPPPPPLPLSALAAMAAGRQRAGCRGGGAGVLRGRGGRLNINSSRPLASLLASHPVPPPTEGLNERVFAFLVSLFARRRLTLRRRQRSSYVPRPAAVHVPFGVH